MNDNLSLSNRIAVFTGKDRSELTRKDLLDVVQKFEIQRFTFHYTAVDGKLKELKLPFTTLHQAERILAQGERVDGSSLFKGLVDSSLSDLYVVPVYRTAFLNPFESRSLDFVCRFLDRNHELASHTTDNILGKSAIRFREKTGFDFWALGELEFFLIYDPETSLYPIQSQGGYHAASPFVKTSKVINEMVKHISRITGKVKYAHAEVGYIKEIHSRNPVLNKKSAEQHEIELLTAPVEDMADFISLARWVIHTVAHRHGMLATFAPKLNEGTAGNGLHFHMELKKDGRNVMVDNGRLSAEARKLIAGLCTHAPTLSAFGNSVASSFLRLVPNQEAPTKICWSDMNRSALIRVPLGWIKSRNLALKVNPSQKEPFDDRDARQTVEIRSPDGSARVYLFLAGLTMAATSGLTEPGMEELTDQYHQEGNIFHDKEKFEHLAALPVSCVDCADLLERKRGLYEKDGIFPPAVIDYVIRQLRREKDRDLARHLSELPADDRLSETRQIMHKDIYRN